MKKLLLLVMLLSSYTISSFAQSLYSNTSCSSRFNPGLGRKGTPIVAYDDVYIPSTLAEGSDVISITKINVGIRRAPYAPATTLKLYYTILKQSPKFNKMVAKKIFLGKVKLPANGNSLITSVVSVGDSATALFKITADTNMAKNGYKILIGTSLDNPSPRNGVILGKALAENEDSIWIENTDNTKEVYATSLSSQLPSSYYLEVFGKGDNPVMADDKNSLSHVARITPTDLQVSK